MECSDMGGIPQFSLVLSASISPTCTNKSICWKIIDDDATLGLQGSLSTSSFLRLKMMTMFWTVISS